MAVYELIMKIIISSVSLTFFYEVIIENYEFKNKRKIQYYHLPFYIFLNVFWVYMFTGTEAKYIPFYYSTAIYVIGTLLTNYILTKFIKDW